MLVPLTCSGCVPAVIEAEAVEFGEAGTPRFEIGQAEQVLLLLEGTRGNHEVVLDDIEFVQQRDMGCRHIGHK